MALATNTTLGTIALQGDLYGGSADFPSLVPSGVVPGTSTNFNSQVIDAKGRIVYYKDYPVGTETEINIVRNNSSFCINNL